jgi:hypothetical protein
MSVVHNDILPVYLWPERLPQRTLTTLWKFEMIGDAVEPFRDLKDPSAYS